MELVLILMLAISIWFILKIKQNNPKQKHHYKIPLKELVKETFPKYKIIEKHGTIMICEINHRNEPEELVFIRVNPNQEKSIKKSGRMIIADYPKNPSTKEMLNDLGHHL